MLGVDLAGVDWGVVAPSVIAGVGVAFAGISARNSHRSAKASAAAAETNREALERSHRPTVVPLPHRIKWNRSTLRLEVHNIGTGPALNLHGRIVGYRDLRPWVDGMLPYPRHIAPGATAELDFQPRREQFQKSDWRVWLFYENGSGRRYWSSVLLTERSQFATELGSGPLPEGLRLPRFERPEAGD